ncbi:MAG: cytochrome C oxidase subunit I [Bacteroidetes bacterium HGW-Bacteroidetes-2]|jgi:nitric oxide reductase subunit B|nr:MAG: cytochrome C oxidase subunit I [Bacteroidetes bacterium HGW-Bacteroidetes-2]
MKLTKNIGTLFLITALGLFAASIFFGFLASIIYRYPEFLKNSLGLIKLRPMHVSAALFWILLAATGSIYRSLDILTKKKTYPLLQKIHWGLWLLAILGIFYSYATGSFGGREYWEYPPVFAIPIGLAWLFFLITFFLKVKSIKKWPVYIWMWMTGIVYFLFIFIENYFWVLPYFRESFIKDMVIQWKAAGSIVGAYNMLVYGTAFFIMERISKKANTGFNTWAFALFFLSFFNMLFNWGHHLYLVPTNSTIHYVGYIVSMTEWVFFIKIIYNWKKQVTEAEAFYHYYPYRFILAFNCWLFFNLTLALFMSIPFINLYMHGTHFITAHAMGTTIGINTMILLAALFFFLVPKKEHHQSKFLNTGFWGIQISLLIFLLSLMTMGFIKSIWFFEEPQALFADMMERMKPFTFLFILSGMSLFLSFLGVISGLVYTLFKKHS